MKNKRSPFNIDKLIGSDEGPNAFFFKPGWDKKKFHTFSQLMEIADLKDHKKQVTFVRFIQTKTEENQFCIFADYGTKIERVGLIEKGMSRFNTYKFVLFDSTRVLFDDNHILIPVSKEKDADQISENGRWKVSLEGGLKVIRDQLKNNKVIGRCMKDSAVHIIIEQATRPTLKNPSLSDPD